MTLTQRAIGRMIPLHNKQRSPGLVEPTALIFALICKNIRTIRYAHIHELLTGHEND